MKYEEFGLAEMRGASSISISPTAFSFLLSSNVASALLFHFFIGAHGEMIGSCLVPITGITFKQYTCRATCVIHLPLFIF